VLEGPEREVMGRAEREAWRARIRKLEVKERELRLLQEQVGSRNAVRVRCFSSYLPFDPPLMKCSLPFLDRRSSSSVTTVCLAKWDRSGFSKLDMGRLRDKIRELEEQQQGMLSGEQ
jgi:hypothetical protein